MVTLETLPESNSKKAVFRCKAKCGSTVSVAGTFNDWDSESHTMSPDANGEYVSSIILAPGKYEYKFIVDGDWMLDEGNPDFVSNDFGTLNSILSVE